MIDDQQIYREPSWRNRRKIIYTTLIFCAFVVGFITLSGKDTSVYEVIVLASYSLAGTVIGAYVFGATWQDVSIEKTRSHERVQMTQITNKRQKAKADKTEGELLEDQDES